MKKVSIGLLFSLTGTTSLTETGQYQSALYALEQFKIKSNHSVEITYELRDICSDPKVSFQQALDLAKSGVKIFVGCYTSACRKAILPILEQYDCLLVYPTLYEGQEAHPNVFYLGEVPNQQIGSLLKLMTHEFGKRIYLIGNDYIYPRYTNQQIREMLQEIGGVVAGEQYVPLGHAQFAPILNDIQKASPSVILSTLVGDSIKHFYRLYYEFGFTPQDLPIFSPITTELEIRSIGPKYAAGHFTCSSYFQSLDNPVNSQFVLGMKKRFGSDTVISSVMANSYFGMEVVLNSVVHLKSIERKKILSFLYGKSFSTPSGTITIELNHHLSREVRIGKANFDGQFDILWSSKEPITAKPFLTKTLIDSTGEEPVWKTLLEGVGEETMDGIMVLDKRGSVLYANHSAWRIGGIKELDSLRESDLNKLRSNCQLVKKDYKNFGVRIFFIKEQGETEKVVGNSPGTYQFGQIETRSPAFIKALRTAEIASQGDASVLLLGETGSGKEVLAKTLHDQSTRKRGPFIAVNAGAIPKDLIASELFGYVEGAFTGSRKGGRAGKFEAADGGTLFLDEIGEMPIELQVSLLRVLEERKVVRIGEHKERPVNVRIIAATNRNLKEEIAYSGSFRSDLYYRLNVFTIEIPPLRNRLEDIESLCFCFLRELHHQYGKGPISINTPSLELLKTYAWPGNIRELRNAIERAFFHCIGESEIRAAHLPGEIIETSTTIGHSSGYSLKNMEKQMIEQALRGTENITEAAKSLGITRSTLYRKIKQWGIHQSAYVN
jgi:sigma-54 dependent transcriptional regulator, acetoin dehydrogenase operon transcriptional activator AcoR